MILALGNGEIHSSKICIHDSRVRGELGWGLGQTSEVILYDSLIDQGGNRPNALAARAAKVAAPIEVPGQCV